VKNNGEPCMYDRAVVYDIHGYEILENEKEG
jgi:hypothetical protein